MVRFNSRTVQNPNQLRLGGPNPEPYSSTLGFCWVWLHPSHSISTFAFRVIKFMVWFKYPTVNSKIVTMVRRCSFWVCWPPLWSYNVDKWSLPYPGNEHQRSINDFRCCIRSNQSGHWLRRVTNEVLASSIGKKHMRHYSCRILLISFNDLRSRSLGNLSGTWLQTSITEILASSVGRKAMDAPMIASRTVTTNSFYNDATQSSCRFWPINIVRISYIHNDQCIACCLPMMKEQQSLMLRWWPSSWWGKESASISFPNNGGQY